MALHYFVYTVLDGDSTWMMGFREARCVFPLHRLTNNQSEILFDANLKRLQKRKEVPVDTILLSSYHFLAFYYNFKNVVVLY